MSYTEPSFVIYHPNDAAAYAVMRSWRDFDNVLFDFRTADTLDLEHKSAAEARTALEGALTPCKAAIVLIGEDWRDATGPVLWPVEAAARSGLPVVCVNINLSRKPQRRKTPRALAQQTALHVSLDMKIVRHALDHWPLEFARDGSDGTQRVYDVPVYRKLYL